MDALNTNSEIDPQQQGQNVSLFHGNTIVHGGNFYMHNTTYQLPTHDLSLKSDATMPLQTEWKGDLAQIRVTTEETQHAVQQLLALSTDQRVEIQLMKINVQQKLSVNESRPVYGNNTGTKGTSPPEPSRSRTLEHLGYEVDEVDKGVARLALDNQIVVCRRPVEPFVMRFPSKSFRCSPRKRHRTLLQEVLHLLGDLEDNADAIDEHAYKLNVLGERFSALEMQRESSIFYTWAVHLYRILMKAHPQDFAPYLAETLANLSDTIPQNEKSLPATEEAVTLMRSIIGPDSSQDLRCQFAWVLSKHANYLTDSLSLHQEAMTITAEALEIYESTLRPAVTFLDLVGDENENLSRQLSSLLIQQQQSVDCLKTPKTAPYNDFDLRGTDAHLCGYSIALYTASSVAKSLDREQESKEFQLKSALAAQHLASSFPNTHLESQLALRLYSLSGFDRNATPDDEPLWYLEEALRIYRRACSYDPKFYLHHQLYCMVQKAEILAELQRPDEALQTLQEILEMDIDSVYSQITVAHAFFHASQTFSRLNYSNEAVLLQVRSVELFRTVKTKSNPDDAYTYLALAIHFKSDAQHVGDAITAANAALQQLQTLAIQNPSQRTASLVSGLLSCIDVFTSPPSHDTSLITNAVKTTFDQYEALVQQDINHLNRYHGLMIEIVSRLRNPDITVSTSLDVVERLRRLSQEHPDHDNVNSLLLNRMLYHGLILNRHNRLAEAITWMENLGEDYQHLADTDVATCRWYINVHIHLALLLKDRGDMKGLTTALGKAIKAGEDLNLRWVDGVSAFFITASLAYFAEAGELKGTEALALENSTLCLSISKSNTLLHGTSVGLVQLHHSRRLTTNQRYEEALATAREATTAIQEVTNDDPTYFDTYDFFWPSEFLRTLASCLADMEDLVEGLAVARQGFEEAQRVRDPVHPLLWHISERCYGNSLWTFGCLQLFSGNRDDALKSFEEVKEIWKQRSSIRKMDMRKLALTQWALGIVYCLVGRHDDGSSAHLELNKLIAGLKFADPVLYCLISVALAQERRRPGWTRVLDTVKEDLEECGHLTDI
ncbi:hypothetical protein CPB83DRAFT_860126 [Crepidotus variabilis]|uniref:TPR-like protein n=1 Tax=Crepidotus variabilis TaxID=179855 RepID=A0A9P6E9E5_9AGAR|nr:hypothetical protein CPB83DRAFT_860126 [Crepidotus variabilis]